jgi:hypothetical protein
MYPRSSEKHATHYRYYFGGAVTARGVLYGEVGYAVGLYDDTMRGATVEGVADRVRIQQETVR